MLRLLRPHGRLCAWALGWSLLARAAALVLPYSSRVLLDRILLPHDLRPLPMLLGWVLGATAVQGLAGFALAETLGAARERLLRDYRVRVQEHVGRLPMAFFDAHSKGELAARIMKDAGGARDLLGPAAAEGVGSLLTGLMAVPFLLNLSVRLAVPVLVYLAFAALVLRRGSRGLQPLYERGAQVSARLSGRLLESLGAARVVKIYGAEAREAVWFQAGAEELARCELLAEEGQARLALGTSLLLLPVAPALLLVGSREVAAGRMSEGSLVAFAALLAYTALAARYAGGLKSVMARALASLRRTEALLGERREGAEPERTETLEEGPVEVVFDRVSFGYEAGRRVVHEVSFSAPAGTTMALVGASGAGKSTVLSLLCGFYRPDAGRVLVNGCDLATLGLGGYREQLGLVPQEAFLFSDSLRANVLFARPGATEAELDEALAASHVEEFAGRWAEGAETGVGERGVKLSGGQQQRLCLARALLRGPALLLLDEATSALDSESEALVQRGMERLRAGRTTLVIAHRLSTIRAADQILVLDAGRIAERGTHADLMALDGLYARMIRAAERQHAG